MLIEDQYGPVKGLFRIKQRCFFVCFFLNLLIGEENESGVFGGRKCSGMWKKTPSTLQYFELTDQGNGALSMYYNNPRSCDV